MRPDTAIASALVDVGRNITGAAQDVANMTVKNSAKMQADAERNTNLAFEYDLLQTGNQWRDQLQEAKMNASVSGEGFTDEYQRTMQPGVDELAKKYETHHDPAYVKLKIAQAQKGYLDAAAGFEGAKVVDFKKTVIDEKVANLSSAFVAGGGVSYEQAAAEYKSFIDSAVTGNERVRDHAYQYGLRTIQSSYIAAQSATPEGRAKFIEHYKKTMSAEANSAVLPPHISTTITNAQAQGADPEMMLAIGWIESRLNPEAGRPRRRDGTEMSSAEGMFQVLAGDNRIAAATRNALGIRREDVKNVDKVSSALSAFLVRKQEWMRANRIEPTPGKTYMMWNMGEGAAAAVMRANPNARIETVLSRVWSSMGPKFLQEALYNNPSMYKPGQTVGQVIANYEAKVQSAKNAVGKITAGAGLTVEDRAKTFVTQFAGIKPDEQHVTAADLAALSEKVIEDHGKQTKAELQFERGQARINGELPMDPRDSDHRKDVEKALEMNFPSLVEGISTGDAGTLGSVKSMATDPNVRHIPEPLRNAMVTVLESGEAGAKNQIYETLRNIRREDRTAFNASNFDSDMEKRISEYEAYTGPMKLTPDVAIARIEKERSEEGQVRSKVMSSEISKELGKFSDKKIVQTFGADSVGNVGIDENKLTPLIRGHFEAVYRNAREDGKDREQAEALATNSLKSEFGVSRAATTDGWPVVMLHPPESYYPALWDGRSKWERWGDPDGHAWITEQARNRVGAHLLMSGRIKSYVGPTDVASGGQDTAIPAWKIAEEKASTIEVRLISTADTADDVRHGRNPTYQLWFRNDQGQVEKVADDYAPDYGQASAEFKARFATRHNPPSDLELKVRRWMNDPEGHGSH